MASRFQKNEQLVCVYIISTMQFSFAIFFIIIPTQRFKTCNLMNVGWLRSKDFSNMIIHSSSLSWNIVTISDMPSKFNPSVSSDMYI